MFWRKNPVTGFEPVADVRLIERWLPIAQIGDGCLGNGASCGHGRLARSGSEEDRGRLAGSDEDAPDDETMDETPDADEIAALERRTLAAEEAQDVERLLDGIGRLPPDDSKLDCLKHVLGELNEAGFAQTMVFTQFTDTMDFLREALRGRTANAAWRGRPPPDVLLGARGRDPRPRRGLAAEPRPAGSTSTRPWTTTSPCRIGRFRR